MKKAGIRASFDNRAATYGTASWHARYAEGLVELAELSPGTTVLDVGTGTGLVAFAAARAIGPSGSVVAVDVSPGMLSIARATSVSLGIEHVRFVEADATEPVDLPAESFDAVLCCAGLLYMSVERALNAWHRLLKPGGLVGFSTMCRGEPPAAELFRQCAREYGVELPDPSAALGSEDACRAVLLEAQFRAPRIIGAQVEFLPADLDMAWDVHLKAVGHEAVSMLSLVELKSFRARYEGLLHQPVDGLESTHKARVLYAFAERDG